MLRRVTETEFGKVVDIFPGHAPDYILLVRIDETKIPDLEKALPKGYSWAITANMGDRTCYTFTPHLGEEDIGYISRKLVELGAQSFEFRDWTNKISPPTKEWVIKTKKSVYPE